VDAATFQEEAMKYQRLLWRVCWSILRNNEDCADAIQEALTRAWQHRGTLRNLRAFRPWLVRILTNTCNDMLRKQIRQKSVPLEDEAVAIAPFTDPVPLADALGRLSPEHRTVTVLHYLEGFSVAEIAEMTGAPTGTVKSRLMYARLNLREMLHDDVDA
jgi:RNA polymerase sigma-70 factor, ECF subfamily